MVATVTPYTDTRNRAAINEGYDGVVRIAVDGYYGSGVLLYGGRAVLTSAHLFKNGATAASVQFETSSGTQSVNSASIAIGRTGTPTTPTRTKKRTGTPITPYSNLKLARSN